MSAEPAWDGYFADPFLLTTDHGFVAYGSSEPFTGAGASFQALTSPDLRTWRSAGTVLTIDGSIGTDVWAPEVVHVDGRWWMYYSAGFGIAGHHLRVAAAESPRGPFTDCGVDLTPDETFAIDPHPFQDVDGSWYLFYARDVLHAERPGTHLAVRPRTSARRRTVSPRIRHADRPSSTVRVRGRPGAWWEARSAATADGLACRAAGRT